MVTDGAELRSGCDGRGSADWGSGREAETEREFEMFLA